VPYGAAAVPIGLEAVSHGEAPNFAYERIYGAYREAWTEAHSKMEPKEAEFAAWQDHKLILIGGGSLVPLLIDTMRIHPDRGEPLTVMKVAQPTDLVQADQTKIAAEQFPLIAVAYGLANKESFLPNPYCRDPGSFSFGRH
jgi:hypothetical protein